MGRTAAPGGVGAEGGPARTAGQRSVWGRPYKCLADPADCSALAADAGILEVLQARLDAQAPADHV